MRRIICDLKILKSKMNLTQYVPAVNLFRFTKSCMGTKFPRMRNFKLLDTSNNSVIMEMDIEYDGDCTLEMEVGTSLANIPLGIKDIKLSGTMRIELRDMVPCSPLISAIVAYFVDPPKMDFDLTGTANVADHPWIASTGILFFILRIKLLMKSCFCFFSENRLLSFQAFLDLIRK